MRNIRLDSLPNDRPVASRDCASCTRRRIKCDRTVSSCLKCASRNLVCPGFKSMNIKWNQGVASRGKLAGSQIPVHGSQTSMMKASTRTPRAQRTQKIPSPSLCMRSESSASYMDDYQDSLEAAFGALLCPSQDLSLVNRYTGLTLLDVLLNHFSVEVVPRLAWVELPRNLWPTALRSLAQGSECLYLSLSCLAATHLSATQAGTVSEHSPFHQLHNRLRELSLRSVNNRITSILTNRPGKPSEETTRVWLTEALASMVALCYSEAFVPSPTRWRLHLRGCHTVVDQLSSHCKRGSEKSVETFLLKEVADLEALDDFSTFSLMSAPTETRDSFLTYDNSFWGFTDLIREITNAERKRQHTQQDQHVSAIDMSAWHARANQSYHGIISSTGDVFSSQGHMRCFKDVVRAHCYATIIYSYQALAPQAISEAAIIEEALFAILRDMCTTATEAMKPFWHDMFFPLLIAGTVCSTDQRSQTTIEHLFLTALSISGAWCNITSLQFLKDYWQKPHADAHLDWIQYARNGKSQSGSFLVF